MQNTNKKTLNSYVIYYANGRSDSNDFFCRAASRDEAMEEFRRKRPNKNNKVLQIQELAPRKNPYEMVTDRILEIMKQGKIPWDRPWTGIEGEDAAISYVTRKPYSLLNQMLLEEPGEYLSFKQAKELGGNIRKGAKAKIVVFYKPRVITVTTEENGQKKTEEKVIPVLKEYCVFHLKDTEGIPTKIVPGEKPKPRDPIESAEALINGYLTSDNHPKFQNDVPSNRAYYALESDKVVVPMLSQYPVSKIQEYYSTAFHELVHSTGQHTRCNRTFGHSKNDPKYAYEELVAEIGAAMLCNRSGVETTSTMRNSAAYLQSWMREFRDDPKMFVSGASKAEKAVRFILGERPTTQNSNPQYAS